MLSDRRADYDDGAAEFTTESDNQISSRHCRALPAAGFALLFFCVPDPRAWCSSSNVRCGLAWTLVQAMRGTNLVFIVSTLRLYHT
jgi:hypothetical protein